MDPSCQTLFYALETDGAANPDGPVLFLYAHAHPGLTIFSNLDYRQPFFPTAHFLGALPDVDAIRENHYALALVLLPHQVEEAKAALARALLSLRPGGKLYAAAANDANGARLSGWLKEKGLEAQSVSKNKARCVIAVCPDIYPDFSDWISAAAKRPVDFGDGLLLQSRPGVFSWNRPDAGSRFLLENLDQKLSGIGADFGCGIGYLSASIMARPNAIAALHMLDADHRALDLAHENLSAYPHITAHWADLSAPVADLPKLDFIVMNPPFHTGKTTKASLGQAFITTAAHHLKKGGRLHMVANAHLPYEKILADDFARVEKHAENRLYKIITAVK